MGLQGGKMSQKRLTLGLPHLFVIHHWLMSKIANPAVSVKPKEKYHLINWSAYNAGLKQRGSLTLWLSEDVAQQWYHQGRPKKGGQFIYANDCILLLLTLKVTFKLPFRQLEGFACSLMELLKLDLRVPDYSQICRRQKGLSVPVGISKRLLGEPVHLVIDSSGLKVYGEGEWKVRQHGVSKRRTWRKLHLAIDEKTGQILGQRLTDKDTDDASQLPELVQQVQQTGVQVSKTGADGSYDTFDTYQFLIKARIEPIIPPRINAAWWVDQHNELLDHPRNRALEQIDQGGLNASRKQWKQDSGYHRRSKAENTFFRWKTIHGPGMYARKINNQQTEAAIKVAVLNRFIQLAPSIAVKVA
jgi:hypothetical protein